MFRANKSIVNSDPIELSALPKDFYIKLEDLESKLHQGILTHENLKDLFECYSVNKSVLNFVRLLQVTMKQWT